MEQNDFKLLKKDYGEKFAKYCRELFPTLMERGILYQVISSCFAPNHELYYDIHTKDEFKDFIYSKIDNEEKNPVIVDKTPAELLKEVGYTLYECKTDDDIQQFRKYYAKNEELCTFRDRRLNRCFVFFAIKDNVDEIKREDFAEPDRQDEYGTSVISIQFTRDSSNTVSIKNRYNHTVNNPDATFSNNLENIAPGLTEAFNKEYNLKTSANDDNFELRSYVKAKDGRFYKYNYEENNIYYCLNNIIIDNFEVKHFDKEKYIVFDYFIFDMQKDSRGIYQYDDSLVHDCFPETIGEIKKFSIKVDPKYKNKEIIINDNIEIILDYNNRMIIHKNPNVTEIGDDYLWLDDYLRVIDLPNVYKIGDDFITSNYEGFSKILLPKVEIVGDNFITSKNFIGTFDMSNIRIVGSRFLMHSIFYQNYEFPNLEKVDHDFMRNSNGFTSLNMPNLKSVGDNFFSDNKTLKTISLPNLEIIGNYFVSYAKSVETVYLPKAKKIGYRFMSNNDLIEEISLPLVKDIKNGFLFSNRKLKVLNIPSISNIDFSACIPFAPLKLLNGIPVDQNDIDASKNDIISDLMNSRFANKQKKSYK